MFQDAQAMTSSMVSALLSWAGLVSGRFLLEIHSYNLDPILQEAQVVWKGDA